MKKFFLGLFIIFWLLSLPVHAAAPEPEKSEETSEPSRPSITVRFVGGGLVHPCIYQLPAKTDLSEALPKLKLKPSANGVFEVRRNLNGEVRVFKFKISLKKTPFPSTNFELINQDEVYCDSEIN